MSNPPSLYPCPGCGAGANLSTGCPRCGRAPDPVAAEVVRLDGEIVALAARVEQTRQAYAALVTTLDDLRRRRAELAAQVRVAAATRPTPAPVTPAAAPAPVRPEASTRTVQNLLFVLGGLLLCAAAIVFIAVTWSVVGVAGRAAILAGVTAGVLALPPLAKRRGLTATAETFSVVGLLLVALDGYAAWSVNLLDVRSWPGATYAALVWGVSAAVALGYHRSTRLDAPWFTALALVQPVLPLLVSEADPGVAGWALVFAALAGFNLAVVHVGRVRSGPGSRSGEPVPAGVRVGGGGTDGPAPGGVAPARRAVGWVAYAAALAIAAFCGLIALLLGVGPGAPVLAGGPLLVAVTALVAGAVLTRNAGFQAAAGLVVVLSLAASVLRPVLDLVGPWEMVVSAVVVTVLAGAVAWSRRWLPVEVWRGPWVGGLLLVGALGSLILAIAAITGQVALDRRRPSWWADGTGPVSTLDWQAPVTVLLLAFSLAVLLPRPTREPVGVAGVGLAVLAFPAALPLPWWGLAVVELALAVPLLLAAVRVPAPGVASVLVRALVGAALAGHALLVAFARPASAAAALGTIMLTGLVVAVLAGTGRPGRDGTGGDEAPDPVTAVRRMIGGASLAVGLLAVPATTTVGLFAAGAQPWWQARAALASGVLVLGAMLLVRRHRPGHLPYADTALAGTALVTGLAPLAGRTDEPVGLYSALALLLVVAALQTGGALTTRGVGARTTDTEPVQAPQPGHRVSGPALASLFCVPVLAFPVLLAVAPTVGAVLLGPYGWLGQVWSGAPAGVGLAPYGWPVDGRAAAALVVLTAVLALAGWSWHRTIGGAAMVAFPVAATAVPVVLACVGANWPVVPGVALLGGLAALLAGTVPIGRTAAPGATRFGLVSVPVGVLLAGAGLAGALPTKASTLLALSLVVLVATAIGAAAGGAAPLPAVRIVGWLVASGAALTLAVAVSRAAELPLRVAALVVLGVAVAVLAGGVLLRGRRSAESIAIEAAGHAGALVALLLTVGSARYAAAVATIWGVVVGVRALRPGEPARRRSLLASAAAGCELLAVWVLLASAQVAVLEAYTLPTALCALVVGALALHVQPALSSWVTHGPGLAAALLPSLASVLVDGDQPWRRLLLGVGALAVVLAGAHWRRQAPVLLGGATLAVVALHEVVGAWDQLPRWIFLAAGGLALIGLAITYERRRRDLVRWRAAVSRMS
ncbi:PspA/IM30 family protein [Micromonospora sp. NPDC050417]|uniref:PspA/IM30 family protein n=1 Tax=Micromonospora sp. NPDC050417 TaxID=3364280 RepID=UPI00378AE299